MNNLEHPVKARVQQFIAEQFLVEVGTDIEETTHLFQAGHIDSYGFIELVNFLEQEFAVAVTEEELVSDAFVSVAKIVAWVEERVTCRP